MTTSAPVRVDRVTLTEEQMRALEIVLYRSADLVNRLLASAGVQYTKILAPAAPAPMAMAPPPQPAPPLKPEGWQFGGQTALTQRPDTRGGV